VSRIVAVKKNLSARKSRRSFSDTGAETRWIRAQKGTWEPTSPSSPAPQPIPIGQPAVNTTPQPARAAGWDNRAKHCHSNHEILVGIVQRTFSLNKEMFRPKASGRRS
jgi:hypothetical protein